MVRGRRYKYGMAIRHKCKKGDAMNNDIIKRLDGMADRYKVAFLMAHSVFKNMVDAAREKADAKVNWPFSYDSETGPYVCDVMQNNIARDFYQDYSDEYNPFTGSNYIETYEEAADGELWGTLTDMQICERLINYWASVELQRQIDAYPDHSDADDYNDSMVA